MLSCRCPVALEQYRGRPSGSRRAGRGPSLQCRLEADPTLFHGGRSWLARLRAQRQGYGEYRAAALGIFYCDLALHCRYELADDPQSHSEAAAARLGPNSALETAEDARTIFNRNAGAVISN